MRHLKLFFWTRGATASCVRQCKSVQKALQRHMVHICELLGGSFLVRLIAAPQARKKSSGWRMRKVFSNASSFKQLQFRIRLKRLE